MRALWNDRIAGRVGLGGGGRAARLLLDRLLLNADQGFSVAAIENVDPTGLASLGDALAQSSIVDLIEQHHRARAVEIPQVMMHLLEMPGVTAVEVQRHDRGAEQIVAGTVGADADGVRTRLAGAEIDKPEIRIDRCVV